MVIIKFITTIRGWKINWILHENQVNCFSSSIFISFFFPPYYIYFSKLICINDRKVIWIPNMYTQYV